MQPIMTFLLWLISGIALATLYEYFVPKFFKKDALIISGYRLHHSLYGLAGIILGLSLQNNHLLALGIGILIQHTATDGFRFLSKEK